MVRRRPELRCVLPEPLDPCPMALLQAELHPCHPSRRGLQRRYHVAELPTGKCAGDSAISAELSILPHARSVCVRAASRGGEAEPPPPRAGGGADRRSKAGALWEQRPHRTQGVWPGTSGASRTQSRQTMRCVRPRNTPVPGSRRRTADHAAATDSTQFRAPPDSRRRPVPPRQEARTLHNEASLA